jgi:hypothetical protein
MLLARGGYPEVSALAAGVLWDTLWAMSPWFCVSRRRRALLAAIRSHDLVRLQQLLRSPRNIAIATEYNVRLLCLAHFFVKSGLPLHEAAESLFFEGVRVVLLDYPAAAGAVDKDGLLTF